MNDVNDSTTDSTHTLSNEIQNFTMITPDIMPKNNNTILIDSSHSSAVLKREYTADTINDAMMQMPWY